MFVFYCQGNISNKKNTWGWVNYVFFNCFFTIHSLFLFHFIIKPAIFILCSFSQESLFGVVCQNDRAGNKNNLCMREKSTTLHISLLSIFGKHFCCSWSASGYHQTWGWCAVDWPIKSIDRLLVLFSTGRGCSNITYFGVNYSFKSMLLHLYNFFLNLSSILCEQPLRERKCLGLVNYVNRMSGIVAQAFPFNKP